ncbi:MAG: TlpA family protein disulfide reductase [Thermoanaerobaculia bacterium]
MKKLPTRLALAMLLLTAASAAFAAQPVADVQNEADIAKHFDRNAKVRVLNLWATWCAPCVAEMPALQAIHSDYRGKGVSLVAVSMDDVLPGSRDEARDRVSKFLAAKSITFPNVLYAGRVTTIEEELRLSGEIPVTIVYDAKGVELARIEGILEEQAFRAQLDKILSTRSKSTR